MADLTGGILTGRLVSVEESPDAAGLMGGHAAGATTLTVSDGSAFYASGSVRVDVSTYSYTRVDNVLTITPGLTAPAEDGDSVHSLSVTGADEKQLIAHVDLDGDGSVDTEAIIPVSENGYYTVGVSLAGALVAIEPAGAYDYRTVGRPTEVPSLDANMLAWPYITAYLRTNVSVAHGAIVPVDWSGTVRNARMIANPTAPHIKIPKTGIYIVTASAAFAANSTGNRYVTIHVADSDGANEVQERVVTGAASAVGSTIVQAVKTLPLEAGQRVIIKAQQNSGAELDLLAGLAQTAVEMAWVAPR